MKKNPTKTIVPFTFLLLALIFIGSSCGGESVEEQQCDQGIFYKLDGTEISFDNANVTAEIHNDAIIGKFYDIWTDENGGFYFHSTITENDETSQYASDWFTVEDVANIIFLNNKTNVNMTFTIIDGTDAVGDHVEISFSGSYEETGVTPQITNGIICTNIDIVN